MVAYCFFASLLSNAMAVDQGLLTSALSERADIEGEVIRVPLDQASAIAVYRRGQLARGRGAVLILHAPGSTPDDPVLVRPLRLGLSDAGWDTLAVQLPLRFTGESHGQWLERNEQLVPLIAAASNWLDQQGQSNQVLLGIGSSGQAALSFVGRQDAVAIQAVVLISTPIEAGSDAENQLAAVDMPLLDVMAQHDLRDVISAAELKRRLAGANPKFSQREIAGAVSGFVGMEGWLVSTVRAWLAAHTRARQPGSPAEN